MSSIFADHINMRLEMNYWEKKRKKDKHMEAEQYVTKQPMILKKSKRK